MGISGFEKTIAAYGQVLPLAFVYGDTAYYFDVDGFDDARTTAAVHMGDDPIEGKVANDMLMSAVRAYGRERHRVWIAKWFRDCVSNELDRKIE